MNLKDNDHEFNKLVMKSNAARQVRDQRRYYINGLKIVLIWLIAVVTCFFDFKLLHNSNSYLLDMISIPTVASLYVIEWKIFKAILAHENSIKIGHVSFGLIWFAFSGTTYDSATGEFDCRTCYNYSITLKDERQPWFGYHEEWYDGPFPSYVIFGISFNWSEMPYIVKEKSTGKTWSNRI